MNTTSDLAECGECGRNKPVCCDTGYRDLPDGTVAHDDARCEDCCQQHNHSTRSQLIYDGERMDCDQ